MKNYLLAILLLTGVTLYSQNIDIDILRDINLNRNTQLDNVFKVISNSTDVVVAGTLVLLFGIGLTRKNRLTLSKTYYVGSTVLLTLIISNILKYIINRPRPFITYPDLEKVTGGGSPSFPSGHTSDAFALATSLSIAYPKWYIIGPSYAWAVFVGYSRMDLGSHYPSDVLAGAVIGAGVAYLCYKGQKWISGKRKDQAGIS